MITVVEGLPTNQCLVSIATVGTSPQIV